MPDSALHNVGNSLIIVHKAVTRSLTMAIQSSQNAGPKPEHHEGYQKYIQALVSLLDAHHLGEEEIAFPYLQKIISNGPFNQLIDHHRQIMVFLGNLKGWSSAGDSGWDRAEVARLHNTLIGLNNIWLIHIELEEATLGPASIDRILTPEESDRLDKQISAHGQQHATPPELVLPFLLYNLTAGDRKDFSNSFPPVVVEQLIPHAWEPVWRPMKPFLLQE
jgi:hypothetical protein